jgi:hypothetical protein
MCVGSPFKNEEVSMNKNVVREQGLRWASQAMMVLLILVAAFAVAQYMKVGELESAASQAQAESRAAHDCPE